MSQFMLPEGLAAAAAASPFLQIHMGACSAPSPGTWPVISCESIIIQMKRFHNNSELNEINHSAE